MGGSEKNVFRKRLSTNDNYWPTQSDSSVLRLWKRPSRIQERMYPIAWGGPFSRIRYTRDAKTATQNNSLLSPVKAVKGKLQKKGTGARPLITYYLLPYHPSEEPIEAFFSWLNEKNKYPKSLCKSMVELIIHVMEKIAIAFTTLIFNYWFK